MLLLLSKQRSRRYPDSKLSVSSTPSFADLLREIAIIPPKNGQRFKQKAEPRLVLRRWIGALTQPVDSRIGPILFRLLFPEEDSKRRYSMQEVTLAKRIAKALHLSSSSLKSLLEWAQDPNALGCLGLHLSTIALVRIIPIHPPILIGRLSSFLLFISYSSRLKRAPYLSFN